MSHNVVYVLFVPTVSGGIHPTQKPVELCEYLIRTYTQMCIRDRLPSELAALLELEVEDIKHQGGRLKGVAEGDVGKRSVEIVRCV